MRVVVLSHGEPDLTLACLRSVLDTHWPRERLDVVLVDNASPGTLVARVRDELPTVRVIENPTNLGFAAGVNVGLRDRGDVDYLALVNNDATVRSDWLAPLVETLASDPSLGAVSPKVLLAAEFVSLTLRAPTHRRGRGDPRELGVRLSGVRVDGTDVLARTKARQGTWGPEPSGVWTASEAEFLIPVPSAKETHCDLRLDAERSIRVVASSGSARRDLDVDRTPAWFAVTLEGTPIDVINNVGTELTPEDFGADRGYLQPDDGRFDDAEEIFAWSGGAVLLRREYLDDVGLFDERLFLYYEDVDLAWVGREHGWRYQYVPESVVRHVHSATSVEGSPQSRILIEANRLLVLTRHTSRPRAARATIRFLLATASYARRDILSPLLRGRRPDVHTVALRLRALLRYFSNLPRFAARQRRRVS